MSRTMLELIDLVQVWAKEKGIYDKSTDEAQLNGAISELFEFREAVIKGESDERKIEELGDVFVQLINSMTLAGGAEILKTLYSSVPIIVMTIDKSAFESVTRQAAIAILLTQVAQVHVYMHSLARFIGEKVTLTQCLDVAYEKISKRKGAMKNGKFVKIN